MKKILWRSQGGLGKQIASTAAVKALRAANPDSIIHVLTSYPEVFIGLESVVNRVYPFNPVPYFYEDHQDFEIIEKDPYTDLEYRQGKRHIIGAWGIPDTEKQGTLILTEAEKATAKQFLSKIPTDKKIVAFQSFGGTSYYNQNEAQNPDKNGHVRSLDKDTAQEIVDLLVQKGFVVLHIGLATEPRLNNCLRLSDGNPLRARNVIALINECHYGIFIDSFAQHAWAALGKKDAIVLWGGTNPNNLGYDCNKNLSNSASCPTIHCNRPNLAIFDVVGDGSSWKCKNDAVCMKFSAERIVKELIGDDEE